MNNRQVLDGGGFNYHTKVLLNTLLNYDKTATTTHLRSSGFWADRDDANALTAADSIGADYEKISTWKSLTEHKKRFSGSKWVEVSIDLQLDVMRSSREWPSEMNVELEIHRNSDDYLIMQGPDDNESYSVEMKDMQLLFVRCSLPLASSNTTTVSWLVVNQPYSDSITGVWISL